MNKTILRGLALACAMVSAGMAAEDIWTSQVDMPTARMFLSTSVVDGKIYAIGGCSVREVGLPTVERYNPTTGTWTTLSPMPTPRWGLSASVVNGKIYAIGGARGWPHPGLQTVEEYDPGTDTWTAKSPMPSARWSPCTSVVGGKIYAVGGEAPDGLKTMHEYDPVTDSWTQKASMTVGRYAFSTSVVNSKIYAIGGVSFFPSSTSVVEEYDPELDTWTRKADMPEARTYHSACELNGRVYVFGGAPHPNGDPMSAVYEYDPATDTWATKTEMLTTRTVCSASKANGKIYVIGGSRTGFAAGLRSVPTAEGYDPYPLVVDFNGDGRVDGADFRIMLEYWYENEPFCDIAPRPVGDGIVDVQDLTVLAEWIGKELNDSTLAAHWALDEAEGFIVHDSAGDNHGRAMGLAMWLPDGGRIGGALKFTGADFVTADSPLSPDDGCFSILASVKGGAPGEVILSQSGVDWLMADPVDGTLMIQCGSSGALCSQAVITDGTWHRVGFTSDGFHRILCVDDQEVARDTEPAPQRTAGRLLMGTGKTFSPGTYWTGLIDDVRIYNRAVKP